MDPSASRELIRKWVESERIVSAEAAAWKTEKQSMQDLLNIFQKELTLLDEELAAAGASVDNVDLDKENYTTSIRGFSNAQKALDQYLTALVPRLQRLITFFPEPLMDEIVNDVKGLEGAKTTRERLKAVIAVLNAAEKFNRSIHVSEETRAMADGRQMQVDVIYLGLCRAYYCTRAGSIAGIGTPASKGWQWSENGSVADEVRQVIAIYHALEQPEVVQLPVQILTMP